MKGKVFVGTSGYNYPHWGGGVFYPTNLPQKNWLEYYAKYFDTVELNVTFYRLPKKETFEGWYRRTPPHFIFAVKGSRFITHVKRLSDCEEPLKLFFNRANGLKEKLGVVLWQLPPGLHLNLMRLENFCRLLREKKYSKNVRHAFEFRHQSWFCSTVYQLLEKEGFSLCIAHSNRWPSEEALTANFVYLRFHGGLVLYGSNYSYQELQEWADKAKSWLIGKRDIFAYFNNDAYGYALKNAIEFRQLLMEKKA